MFMRMVSHPGQFSFLFLDGVLSWSWHQNCKRDGYNYYQREFMSISCLPTGAARDPGHGTRIARGMGTIIISMSLCLYLVSPLVPQEILVMAPELQEDGDGTITGNVY